MTTPTIDSQLSGQTTGTIKVPDYTAVLQSIADSLAYKPPQVVLAMGDVTGSVFTTLQDMSGISVGYFITGTGIPPGAFVTNISNSNLLGVITWTINLSVGVSSSATGVTYTFMSPLVTLALNVSIIQSDITMIQGQAASDGIHVKGPYAWLGVSSILKLYQEQGVDLAALKAQVDAVPKGF